MKIWILNVNVEEERRNKMNDNQLGILIGNMMIGLSFLADGVDRLFLIILGILWFIGSIIVNRGETK